MRIGIHTSIAGELKNAALRASELGANTFQIFSCSPRSWNFAGVNPDAAIELRRTREKLDLQPLVVHDNYLINLAAADETIRRKSIAAFRAEIGRALAVGADYLVMHPGSSKGQAVQQAIATLVSSLAAAAGGVRFDGLTILLENTAGAGATIGRTFEELREIHDQLVQQADIEAGYCLDTAHCLASGYDVATGEGLERTIAAASQTLGLSRIPVIHTNDSKAPLGSQVDRHEHIGRGYIGKDGFRRILQHPKLRGKAFILETPIDKPGDDRRNLNALKRLAKTDRMV
ncbi:MAG: deoxyribonuclease IV [Acidobacteriales bacterium]|nr:deoxyribonuclease IV [Terriglobales bacterium]